MNDMIDNLVARSVDTPTAVRPRPVSLFEPLPPGTGPVGRPAVLSPVDPGDELEATPPPARLPRPPARPAIRPATAGERRPVLEPRSADGRPEADVSQSVQPPRPPVPAPPVLSPAPAPPGPPSPIPARPAPARLAPEIVREPVVERRPLQPASERRQEIESQSRLSGSPQPLRPAVASPPRAMAEPGLSRPSTIQIVATQPPTRPASGHDRPLPGAAVPAPLPAPTIQVTIGRVEVRATPAAAAPPGERRGPAVMGLEDYLRLRYGGQR